MWVGGGQSRGFLLAGSGEGGERGCRPPVSLGLAVPAQGNSLVAEESCLTEGLGLGKLLKGKLSHCRPFSGPCLFFFFFFKYYSSAREGGGVAAVAGSGGK